MKTELHAARDFPRARLAFTLIEVLIAFFILTLVIAGVCYGYSQANQLAMWSSMSQAAQSYALQGLEQSRAAKWNPWDPGTNTGEFSQDEMPPGVYINGPDYLDIPMKGNPYSTSTNAGSAFTNSTFVVTNYVTITTVSNAAGYLRQIQSVAYWTFPLTGKAFSNVVVTLRTSDQ